MKRKTKTEQNAEMIVNFRISKDAFDKLNLLCARFNVSRSRLLRKAVDHLIESDLAFKESRKIELLEEVKNLLYRLK